MTEQILNRLNQTLENHRELQAFRGRLPDNLMNTADTTVEDEIPKTLNQILNLLNSINNEEVFSTENNVEELQELLRNEQESLDYLFHKAENDEDIIATNLSRVFNTAQILDTLRTGFVSHCETITLTLATAKLSGE